MHLETRRKNAEVGWKIHPTSAVIARVYADQTGKSISRYFGSGQRASLTDSSRMSDA